MSKRKANRKTNEPVTSVNWLDDMLPVEIADEIAGHFMPLEVLVFSLTSRRHQAQMKPFKKRAIRIACLHRCHACGTIEAAHLCSGNGCYVPQPGTVIPLMPSKLVRISSPKLDSLVYRDGIVCFSLSQSVIPCWARHCRDAARAFSFNATKPTAVSFLHPLSYTWKRATVFEKVLICWDDQATQDKLEHLLLSC